MTNWRDTLVDMDTPIMDAIATINQTRYRIALVVDGDGSLAGTITDGDIRRGLLRNVQLDAPVTKIMNDAPRVASDGDSTLDVRARMKRDLLIQMPLVNEQGQPVGLEFLNEMDDRRRHQDNWVLIMAGGLGMRLRPLTEDTPKPLLKVGGKPVLETIIENLVTQGLSKFYLAVNYCSEQVMEFVGDGSRFGADVRYIEEEERLGTGGALRLIEQKMTAPLIVMNGDLLTNLDFTDLLNYHSENESAVTMCVREYDFQVPFGVVELDDHAVKSINEKPVHRFFVNAGIYVLSPDVLDQLPDENAFDMPNVVEGALQAGGHVSAFPIREYWLDIGQLDDLRSAQWEFNTVFGGKS